MIDLGTLPGFTSSRATALNDSDQVVGQTSGNSPEGNGFSWTPTEGMVDIGTLRGLPSFPTAVNASGQVVGSVHKNALRGDPTTRSAP